MDFIRLRMLIAVLLALTFSPILWAQDADYLKYGVVKITAMKDGKGRVGAGTIVRIDKDTVYIVTAAHVVGSDANPRVTFYHKPGETFPARIIGIESEDVNGLAALVVKGSLPVGLQALTFDPAIELTGGEPVMLIGFPPNRRDSWAVMPGSFNARKGKQLTFQASVDEGHSGGPLLVKRKVAGVVTEARGEYGFAVPVQVVHLTLRGWRIEPQDQGPLVYITGSLGNDGWVLYFNLREKATEMFYRFEGENEFKSAGLSRHIDRDTGRPIPYMYVSGLELVGPTTVFVKYYDLEGVEKGPYKLQFDPKKERVSEVKDLLFNITPNWLHYELYQGRLLVYFTHLLSWKDAIKEIRYSVDDETISRKLSFEPWTAPGSSRISDKDEMYIELQPGAKFVSVKLVFSDGTESDVKKFPRPQRLDVR